MFIVGGTGRRLALFTWWAVTPLAWNRRKYSICSQGFSRQNWVGEGSGNRMKDTGDLLLPEAPMGRRRRTPRFLKEWKRHSKKPVLVRAGLWRKPVCSYLTRPTTHQGFEKCTNTGLRQLGFHVIWLCVPGRVLGAGAARHTALDKPGDISAHANLQRLSGFC